MSQGGGKDVQDHRPWRRIAAWMGALGALWLLPAACGGGNGGSDGGGSELTVSMSFVSPAAGQDLLWLAEGQRDGDFLIVDVMARDITQPFDAYEVEVLFDPMVLRAASTQDGMILPSCSSLIILASDNIGNGGASSGSLLMSASALDDPACTSPGERVLARLAFQGLRPGTSTLAFVPYNGDPADPRGSRLFGPMGPAAVSFVDSQALVTVQQ
jgi:hypothetical protein